MQFLKWAAKFITVILIAALPAVISLTLDVGQARAQQIIYDQYGRRIVVPRQYNPVYPTPSHPVIVTPNQATGINPHTGGIDTSNTQINNTFFDPHRQSSMNNGTRRWERRQVHDQYGNVIGYKEGWVWNNSVTGQEHEQMNSFTPNTSGGVNSSSIFKY